MLKHIFKILSGLLEQLRIGNAPSPADVEYAVMEGNGELSVIPKADKKPLTPSDMGITKEPELMPLILITDGVLYNNNLTAVGWTEDKLKTQLKTMNIDRYEDVFLAYCDESSKLHVYLSNQDGSKAKEVTVCATS